MSNTTTNGFKNILKENGSNFEEWKAELIAVFRKTKSLKTISCLNPLHYGENSPVHKKKTNLLQDNAP